MVGAGFSSGLLDGAAFVEAIARSGGSAAEAGTQALQRYNEIRLTPNRRRVLESLAATRELLLSTQSR